MLSDDELAEIERLANAATPGPWALGGDIDHRGHLVDAFGAWLVKILIGGASPSEGAYAFQVALASLGWSSFLLQAFFPLPNGPTPRTQTGSPPG